MPGKRSDLSLKKVVYQSCPALTFYLGNKLTESLGVPSSRPRFVRTYINGGFYSYMMDLEPVNEAVAIRAEPEGVARDRFKTDGSLCPAAVDPAKIGDLFKTDGGADDGPWGICDLSPLALNPLCPQFDLPTRYRHSYERQTHSWKGDPVEIVKLIEDLDKARAGGLATMKAFLDRSFDVDLLAKQIAVRNWGGTFDDAHHNYNLYKRTSDGKWILIPADFESEFVQPLMTNSGTNQISPAMSFYIGEQGDRSNRVRVTTPTMDWYWNRLKDAYFKVYKADYNKLLRRLSLNELSTATVSKLVDDFVAGFNLADYKEAVILPPVAPRVACDIDNFPARVKKWAVERNLELARQIPP
jgi:hypothetical protein